MFGKNARRELVGGHFQTEKGGLRAHILFRRNAVGMVTHPAGRRIIGDVGGERCLAHAGTPGKDHKIRVMEAADLLIEAGEARCDAGHMTAAVERALRHLHRHGGGGREALDRSGFALALRYLVERDFRLLDLLAGIDILARIKSVFNKFPANIHKLPEKCQIINLRREVARAQERRPIAGQLGEITDATQFLQRGVLFQQRLQRYRVGDHVPLDKLHDRFVDAAMQGLEEMLSFQLELDILHDAVVDHQRAQQRCLRLHVAGEFRHACFHDRVHLHQFDHPPLIAPAARLRKGQAAAQPAKLWRTPPCFSMAAQAGTMGP